MRRLLLCTPMIILLLALSACGSKTSMEDEMALQVRTEYIGMNRCEGDVNLLADYGQRVYEYRIHFLWERDGEMSLTFQEPEELAGITAKISKGETRLEFEGESLETGPISQDGRAPIDSLLVILGDLMEGYIAECGRESLGDTDCLRMQVRDPEKRAGEGLETVLWINRETKALVQGELMQDGVVLVRCEFVSFTKE